MLQGLAWGTGHASSPPGLYHSGGRRPVLGTWPSTERHRRHAPLTLNRSLGRCPWILYWRTPEHEREGATLSRTWPEKLGITRR